MLLAGRRLRPAREGAQRGRTVPRDPGADGPHQRPRGPVSSGDHHCPRFKVYSVCDNSVLRQWFPKFSLHSVSGARSNIASGVVFVIYIVLAVLKYRALITVIYVASIQGSGRRGAERGGIAQSVRVRVIRSPKAKGERRARNLLIRKRYVRKATVVFSCVGSVYGVRRLGERPGALPCVCHAARGWCHGLCRAPLTQNAVDTMKHSTQ